MAELHRGIISFLKQKAPVLLPRLVVENEGFEPSTPCVQGRCSPAELIPRKTYGKSYYFNGISGANQCAAVSLNIL